jgi:hypothetical protein
MSATPPARQRHEFVLDSARSIMFFPSVAKKLGRDHEREEAQSIPGNSM